MRSFECIVCTLYVMNAILYTIDEQKTSTMLILNARQDKLFMLDNKSV